jgi:molybdenum cofactor guanylyltransferase
MGRPKASLMFGGCTILERLIAELGDSFDDLVIVGAPEKAETFPIANLIQRAAAVRLLRDRVSYQGPVAALALGLAAVRNEVAFACSCDLPLLRVEVALALCGMLNGYEAVIPYVGRKPQPLCAVYRRDARAVLEMQLASGERRLTRVAAKLRVRRPKDVELRQIDPELLSFFNVNTPEDYRRALDMQRLFDNR